MTRYTIAFADSEVASIRVVQGEVHLRLSAAAAVEWDTQAAGHLQAVELRIEKATWQGQPGSCFGRLSEGRLVEGSTPRPRMALPYRSTAPVALELRFGNGETLAVQGHGLRAWIDGPARFSQSLAC